MLFYAALFGLLGSNSIGPLTQCASITRELPALAWNTMLEAGCLEVYADDTDDNQQECVSSWYHWAHENLMYGEPCDSAWVKRTRQPACAKALVIGIRRLRHEGDEGFFDVVEQIRAVCRQDVLCGE